MRAPPPDTSRMIVSATGPLDPGLRGLRALYVSLNSPVVTLAALPVGPASALVAVHERAVGATLVVRSARTGTLAFYTAGAAGAADASEAEVAAQTVLSFAESLGFLFEDALAPADAPPEILARWEAWVGETAVGEPPPGPGDALAGAAPGLRLSKFRLPLPGIGPEPGLAHAVDHALRSAAPGAADAGVHGERTRRL